MRRTTLLGLLAATAAACLAAPARAQVIVDTPWVHVHVGRPALPPPPPSYDPPPVPLPPSYDPPPVPVPPPAPAAAPVRPMTVEEFAATFDPRPGSYEVVLAHPLTGSPVKVCFTLPPGCVKKVHVRRRALEFDYGCGKGDVTIRFFRDGGVRVQE
jgi:hypothetical protein